MAYGIIFDLIKIYSANGIGTLYSLSVLPRKVKISMYKPHYCPQLNLLFHRRYKWGNQFEYKIYFGQ